MTAIQSIVAAKHGLPRPASGSEIHMLWTIAAASQALRRGELSAPELLDACLERIDLYESRVHAWVFVDQAGARRQAEERDAQLRRGQWRGPLHGIPIGVKDIFDVFDWPTAAGSRLWAQSIARQDATVVERLRQAGAVLVGKTVTTQYASFDPPPTRNPWNPARTPGGSSSGSAAATACGMCLGALGSQTGDRKSTRLNSSHRCISYAVFCLKKKKNTKEANKRI